MLPSSSVMALPAFSREEQSQTSQPENSTPASTTSKSRKRKSEDPVSPQTPAKANLHNPSGHAVVFSDLKLDDTTAIDHLARSGKYSKMHVVGTGISDHEGAHSHLQDFMKQRGIDRGRTRIRYYSGGKNVLDNKVEDTHEKNFQGTPKPVRYDADTHLAQRLGKGTKVDVYHIAPSQEHHMNKLADNKDIKLRTVHHLSGYNSNLHSGTNREPELKHWGSLNSRIKANHPKADLLLSATPVTFNDQGGSTQPYKKLKNVYPANHLEAAKKDPFHQRSLEKAENYLGPHRQGGNIPHLHPGAHDSQHAGKPLQHLINQARFDEAQQPKDKRPLRDHFNKYLDHALPIVKSEAHQKHPKLAYRLANGVREAFTKSPRLEVCDGVHIACVNAVQKRKDHSAVVSGTFYRDTANEGPNAQLKLKPSQPGDPHHGHLIINQTGKKAGNLLVNAAKKEVKPPQKKTSRL
ncbi:uncharacterized protein FA14DRAFT_177746 [Meira miltonrushii]|uniref:Uncharacterized protein n=1 Tax=Meira miltonrushii TaxID=1280837 RepID=A0A316VQN3_9BASI|nr:uncharacterized protein FA14DRAFT_177746 [Meira miltonrushii]PWN38471.1 hypothetical protein FA14DRAFT_177746 [Meira miltonrushii]